MKKVSEYSNNIKFYLIFLSILNLIDMLCTYIGLKLNLIEESNPLMDFLYKKNEFYFLFIKTMLSVCIFYIIFYLDKNKEKLNKFIGFSFKLVTLLYIIIFLIHIFWITLEFLN